MNLGPGIANFWSDVLQLQGMCFIYLFCGLKQIRIKMVPQQKFDRTDAPDDLCRQLLPTLRPSFCACKCNKCVVYLIRSAFVAFVPDCLFPSSPSLLMSLLMSALSLSVSLPCSSSLCLFLCSDFRLCQIVPVSVCPCPYLPRCVAGLCLLFSSLSLSLSLRSRIRFGCDFCGSTYPCRI